VSLLGQARVDVCVPFGTEYYTIFLPFVNPSTLLPSIVTQGALKSIERLGVDAEPVALRDLLRATLRNRKVEASIGDWRFFD